MRLFSRDYFHRGATIDFHIELRRFAEQHGLTVEFFHSYFDTVGANRNEHPAERLRHLSKVPLETASSSQSRSLPSRARWLPLSLRPRGV